LFDVITSTTSSVFWLHKQSLVVVSVLVLHVLLAQEIITSNKFDSIIKQRLNNILIILWNHDLNSFNFKNLYNMARHKCKTPWWWHRNIKTCRSIYYVKRYCCDINCAFVVCNKKSSIYSEPWPKIDVNDQLHSTAAFHQGMRLTTNWMGSWLASDPLQALWWREKLLTWNLSMIPVLSSIP
jgi:hypothetical protein